MIQIWMEGYAATGERGTAQMIGQYDVATFDEAIAKYIEDHPDVKTNCGPYRNERNRYSSEEAYNNRRSDWNIWACNLFDNQADAIKSFG